VYSLFVGRCQRFGETYCLRLQGLSDVAWKWRDYIGLKERKGDASDLIVTYPEDRDSMFIQNVGKYVPTNMKFRILWDVALYSHVVVDRRFRGAYCLYHRPDDGGSTHL
jgi:hypothetical protein